MKFRTLQQALEALINNNPWETAYNLVKGFKRTTVDLLELEVIVQAGGHQLKQFWRRSGPDSTFQTGRVGACFFSEHWGATEAISNFMKNMKEGRSGASSSVLDPTATYKIWLKGTGGLEHKSLPTHTVKTLNVKESPPHVLSVEGTISTA